MSDRIIRLIDRSRTTTDWGCPRKRYWNYEHASRGVVSATTSLPLYLGTTVHDGLAAIAQGVDIDSIAETARKQVFDALSLERANEVDATSYAHEQASLIEGLLRGFYRHVWPSLMSQYPTVVAVEQEMEYTIDDSIIFMSKPDLILEDSSGDYHYIEYKSSSSKKVEWINSWSTAVQLHSTIKAVEETLGKAPVDVQVVGLFKGFVSYGKQNSPMCYCYRRSGQPPFSQTETRYDYAAGFKRYPTWELEGGVKKWVEDMPDEVLADQFMQTGPIFVNTDLVDSFFEQRKWREHEISMAMHMLGAGNDDKGIMDLTFPQKFESCSPAYGFGCEYKRLCFGPKVDPLEAGFELRTSHHAKELEQQNEVVDG